MLIIVYWKTKFHHNYKSRNIISYYLVAIEWITFLLWVIHSYSLWLSQTLLGGQHCNTGNSQLCIHIHHKVRCHDRLRLITDYPILLKLIHDKIIVYGGPVSGKQACVHILISALAVTWYEFCQQRAGINNPSYPLHVRNTYVTCTVLI